LSLNSNLRGERKSSGCSATVYESSGGVKQPRFFRAYARCAGTRAFDAAHPSAWAALPRTRCACAAANRDVSAESAGQSSPGCKPWVSVEAGISPERAVQSASALQGLGVLRAGPGRSMLRILRSGLHCRAPAVLAPPAIGIPGAYGADDWRSLGALHNACIQIGTARHLRTTALWLP